MRQPTCYKKLRNPACIDLILRKASPKFQSTCVPQTGSSHFNLMTVEVMRKILKKLKPATINYRSSKHFSNEGYRESLLQELSKEVFVNNDDGFEKVL